MKRLITLSIASLMLVTGPSQANPNHYHGYRHGARHVDWIAPLVIGGVVGYALTRPAQPPQSVIIQQQPMVYPNIPPAPIGYHYENILDANCNCYRLVLVSN